MEAKFLSDNKPKTLPIKEVNSHCVKLHRSYSISFNLSNLGKIFRSWIQKDRNYVRKTKRKIFTVVFTHSTERAHEIRKFHVAVVQRRLRNVQKGVMHVQSVCFANMNHLLFCRSRCRRRMRCLSSLLLWSRNSATMVTLRHTSPPCRLNKDILIVYLKTSLLSMLWPRFLSQLHRSVSSVSSTWFVLLSCTGVTVLSPSLELVSQVLVAEF